MDDITKKMIERTKARREALQQKMMDCNPQLQRKRRPLSDTNEEAEHIDQANKLPKKEVAESPNKRSRMEEDNIENLAQDDENLIKSDENSTKLRLRMKKIMSQRKAWEAEEGGVDVSIDYDNVPSPIRHEPVMEGKTSTEGHNSSYKNARKQRLAKLANTLKSREDDITHHDTDISRHWVDEDEIPVVPNVVQIQQQVQSKPISQPMEQQAIVPVKVVPVVTKQPSSSAIESKQALSASPEECLDINSLAQFTNVKRKTNTPHKKETISQKPPSGLSLNKNVKIGSASRLGKCEEINSMTLMQRMGELQRNGCEARQIVLSSSSADDFMEKSRNERMQEIAALKERTSFNMQKAKKNILNPSAVDEDKEEDVKDHQEEESKDEMIVEDVCIEKVSTIIPPDTSLLSDKDPASVLVEESEPVTTETDVFAEDSVQEQEESLNLTALVEAQPDAVATDNGDGSFIAGDAYVAMSDVDEEENDQADIDELFDGMLSEDDDDLLTPLRPSSPLNLPNLSRQKSRKEICLNLEERKQTCNEAEDTHEIKQPSKFQRTCLSKSNSTESIVSLCQEPERQFYTIHSYRTEMRKSARKPVQKKVVRKEIVPEKLKATPKLSSKERISNMMSEVSNLQRVIQQASAALNCCYDPKHGKGTNHEVEAEKLLLITSEKRLALLGEIQHLKNSGKSPHYETPSQACMGSLAIDRIKLPLRTEYIFSMAKDSDVRNHYYFVLIRNGPYQMFATELVSTTENLSGDSLVFKDKFIINKLSSDFNITVEVYSLNHRNRPDGIPINDNKSKGKFSGILHKSLTPRKLRSSKRSSQMPSMMSPGGPNAIRISNFSMIGTTSVSLADFKQNRFTLQKVPFLSPISGQLFCNITCSFKSSIEQRGFLTMFDDVGGLGAWHRRWCALQGGILYSWTYPDDENKKPPHLKLGLRECISSSIATVDRLMCARPNTFELRTMRPRKHGDKQNLISQDTGSVITTKHWLSADTKEEKTAWIECTNQALADVRAWDMGALKPFKK